MEDEYYVLQYTIIHNDVNEPISRGTITIDVDDDGQTYDDGETAGKKSYFLFPSKQWEHGVLTLWGDDNNTEVKTEYINNNSDETIGTYYSAVNKVTLYFTKKPTDVSFHNMELLDTVELMDITNFEDENGNPISDTSDMFANCVNLTSILPPIDMTNVEKCEYMFANCHNLVHLEIGNDGYNLINLDNVKLKKVEIQKSEHSITPWGRPRPGSERIYEYRIDFSMIYMFNDCYSLYDSNIVIDNFVEALMGKYNENGEMIADGKLLSECRKLACINYCDLDVDVSSEDFDPDEFDFDSYIRNLSNDDRNDIERIAMEEARYCYLYAFNGAYGMLEGNYYTRIGYPWRKVNIDDMYIRPITEFNVGVNKRIGVLFEPYYVPCIKEVVDDDIDPDDYDYVYMVKLTEAKTYDEELKVGDFLYKYINPDAKFKWYIDNTYSNCENGYKVIRDGKEHVIIDIQPMDERGIDKNIIVTEPMLVNGKQAYHTLIVAQENMIYYKQTRGLITSDYEALSIKIQPPKQYVKGGKVKIIDELYDKYEPRGQFGYVVKPATRINEVKVIWSSSNPYVCEIDNEGYIYPVHTGKATIRCTIRGDRTKYSEFELTVIRPIERIMFTRKEYEVDIAVAKEGFIRPTIVTYPEGSNDDTEFKYVLYSKDNPNKTTTIKDDQPIKLTKVGTYILECRPTNNKLVSPCATTINVTNKAKSIDFDMNGVKDNVLTIARGKTRTLFYKVEPEDADSIAATYYIENSRIASINRENNVLVAKSIGSTYLQVILDDDKSVYRKIKVEVVEPIKEVAISKTDPIPIGTEMQLKYTMYPPDTTWDAFDWKSSNEKVLKVDQNGKVTAIGLGTAKITITSIYDENVTHTIDITVSGYNVEYTIIPNEVNRPFSDTLDQPNVPCRMKGELFEVTTKDGNVVTGDLYDIDIPMSDITYVKCQYPNQEEGVMSFSGLNLIGEVTKCELPLVDGTNMFRGCTNVTAICPLMGKVVSADHMFYGCESLKEIPKFDASEIKYANGMFRECKSLEESKLVLPKVWNCTQMYKDCINLKYIDCLGSRFVANMKGIVDGCTSLNTVKVVRMGMSSGDSMFMGFKSLEYVNQILLYSYVGCANMFDGCINLRRLPSIEGGTYNIANYIRMFRGCIKMEGKPTAGQFWGNKTCELITDCFAGCVSLENYYTEIPSDWGGEPKVQELELDSYERKLVRVGNVFKITATVYPDYADNISYEWTIDDNIAILFPKDNYCEVLMTKEGKSVIRCKSGGIEREFIVTTYNTFNYPINNRQRDSKLKISDLCDINYYSLIEAYDMNGDKINLNLRVKDVLKENELILNMSVSGLSKFVVYSAYEMDNVEFTDEQHEQNVNISDIYSRMNCNFVELYDMNGFMIDVNTVKEGSETGLVTDENGVTTLNLTLLQMPRKNEIALRQSVSGLSKMRVYYVGG